MPLRAADWRIAPAMGDTGQAEFCQQVLGDKLNLVIDQMTSAVTYRKAFFELLWAMDGGGVVIDDLAVLLEVVAGEIGWGFSPRSVIRAFVGAFVDAQGVAEEVGQVQAYASVISWAGVDAWVEEGVVLGVQFGVQLAHAVAGM